MSVKWWTRENKNGNLKWMECKNEKKISTTTEKKRFEIKINKNETNVDFDHNNENTETIIK